MPRNLIARGAPPEYTTMRAKAILIVAEDDQGVGTVIVIDEPTRCALGIESVWSPTPALFGRNSFDRDDKVKVRLEARIDPDDKEEYARRKSDAHFHIYRQQPEDATVATVIRKAVRQMISRIRKNRSKR